METFKKVYCAVRGYIRNHGSDDNKDMSNLGQQIAVYVNPLEKHVMKLQSLLIWENPKKSLISLVVFTLLYWFLYVWPISILTALSTMCLVFYVHHEWVTKIWPEISVSPEKDAEDWTPVHPNIMSTPEIVRCIEKCWGVAECGCTRVLKFRKHNPAKFCATMVCVFTCTLLVGVSVPGALLLYIISMGLFLSPVMYLNKHRLSPKVTEWFKSAFLNKAGPTRDSPDREYAEFMPEERSEEVQEALSIPFESNKRFAAFFNENSAIANYLNGLPSEELPSINDSMLDDDRLTPLDPSPRTPDMQFTSGHFAESSDEDSFTEGLAFSPRSMDEPDSLPAVEPTPVQSSSEDSLDDDFEVIEFSQVTD